MILFEVDLDEARSDELELKLELQITQVESIKVDIDINPDTTIGQDSRGPADWS